MCIWSVPCSWTREVKWISKIPGQESLYIFLLCRNSFVCVVGWLTDQQLQQESPPLWPQEIYPCPVQAGGGGYPYPVGGRVTEYPCSVRRGVGTPVLSGGRSRYRSYQGIRGTPSPVDGQRNWKHNYINLPHIANASWKAPPVLSS